MSSKKPLKPIPNKINKAKTKKKTTSSLNDSHFTSTNQSLSQNYQEYINDYNQTASLYFITKEDQKTKLTIYDIESKSEKIKLLDTPEPLNVGTCIVQLPNGELFCFGNSVPSNIALIIDNNYEFRVLPSRTYWCFSTGVYFKGNIYCFGGLNSDHRSLDLSMKFDLNKNRWINTIPMPQADNCCHSVIFNGNILIAGYLNRNILLYSIDIDSFSIIPCDFAEGRRKILINVEKLYLIESLGFIYEAEDEYHWNKISKSIVSDIWLGQICWSYNKEDIYISLMPLKRYFKFDLNRKVMIQLSSLIK